MKKNKLSLDSIQGKLSREEMKEITAGSGAYCRVGKKCTLYSAGTTYYGDCDSNFGGGSGGYMSCGCSTNYGVYTPNNLYLI